MEPIKYVEALGDYYRTRGYPPYRWTINTTAPFTRLRKPLPQCRVSMLTSGGISHCSRPPFDAGARDDVRLDAVDSAAPVAEFEVNDSYYDTRDVRKDLNAVFPIERLRELAEDGVIGSLAPRLWSGFMGRIYKRSLVAEAAPVFGRALVHDGVDVLVLVPA